MSSLADAATAWADPWWDESRGLLWNPPGSFEDYGLAARSAHMVPQSAWYAVGLLMRGDTSRAERVLEALCRLQYDRPGVLWHGTFARFAEWPQPPDEGAVEWVDYDPNWRQFLGTTFSVILRTFSMSPAITSRLQAAIALAIEGEPPQRVSPRYSNIALMKAWLEEDESFATSVVAGFDEYGAFDEYGSPTYYGIDLYALALWMRYPPASAFARWGERLWTSLWRDIARWWHPGLRNLCGPYSRSYGMDLTHYVGLLGLWLPEPVVPPLSAEELEHSHDLTMAPLIDLVGGPGAGGDVEFDATDADRVVEQHLADDRVATGWLAPGVMIGGERGGPFRAEGQYHPATAHWSLADRSVGWLRLRHAGPLSAVAGPGTLAVTVHDHRRIGRQPVRVETSHPATFRRSRWDLVGRTIEYDGPPADEHGVIDAGGDQVLMLRI